MKNIILISLIGFSTLINAQKSFIEKSKDGKVIAETFISFTEAIDSLVIKNKEHKFKFSGYEPNLKNIPISYIQHIKAYEIHKIKNKIYMIVAMSFCRHEYGPARQTHIFFIKKNKILKYYISYNYGRSIHLPKNEYIPKTNEVFVRISKEGTKESIYDINLKENKLDSIKPLRKDDLFFSYKLKIMND